MPANTVKIDRSTRWGNPFKIGESATHPRTRKVVYVATAEDAIKLFRVFLQTGIGREIFRAAQQELPGKDLACWCKQGYACHGDVLLEVANMAADLSQAA